MSNDFELLVRSYAAEVQALNDAATELIAKVSLDEATGVQLDGLGALIGIGRTGLTDEQYRAVLRAQVQVNTSGGTIEQLNEIVRLATGSTEADGHFSLVEDFPAGFKIEYTVALTSGLGPLSSEAVYQAKAAGVHGVFQFFNTTPVFAFDGSGGSQFDGGYYLLTAIRNRGARESEIL